VTTLAFVIVVGISLLALQTTSLGFLMASQYKPDLLIALVVWATLRLETSPGLCAAFIIGLLVDVLSGSPLGLFAVLYSFVFIVCRQLNATFHIDGHVGRGAMVAGSVVVIGFFVLLSRYITGLTGFSWNSIIWILGKSAISGIIGILVIAIVENLHESLMRTLNPQ
jgi:rod shape-determining protein MreD